MRRRQEFLTGQKRMIPYNYFEVELSSKRKHIKVRVAIESKLGHGPTKIMLDSANQMNSKETADSLASNGSSPNGPLGSFSAQGSGVSPNNGKPAAFRERACDFCRKQKRRCNFLESELTCTGCKAKKIECTFVDEPTRRKKRKPSNHDIQYSVSAASGSGSGTVTGAGVVPVHIPVQSLARSSGHNQGIIDETVGDYSNILGPSLLKRTLGLQNSRCSMLIGSTDILDYGLLNQACFNTREEAERELPRGNRLRRANSETIFFMQDDAVIEGYETISPYVEAIEKLVAPHGPALVDIYFKVIHPSYPILHKKVVLEKYKRSYKEFSPPLLGAIYALALGWWAYMPSLPADQLQNKPNKDAAYQLALESFSHMAKRPKLSAVQAGLLLLQYQKVTQNGTWPLLSQVVALAQDVGLHLDCKQWKIPRWERKLRRRLAWAVWVEDKWFALTHSRPSLLNNRADWLVTPLNDEDFPDKPPADGEDIEGSSDVYCGKLIFQYLVYLTDVVDHLLRSLYTARSLRDLKDTMEILQVARPLQQKLKDWAISVPEDIKMSSLKNRKFSSNGYLYLAYLSAEITLHRRIIHSLDESSTPPDLIRVCRSAAKERLLAALDFVRDLRPEHVHAYWHSSASSNFALIGSFALLLLITAIDKEEANFIQNALKNYRWMLRVSSVSTDQMRTALRKLDACLNFMPGLITSENETSLDANDEDKLDSEISDEGANDFDMDGEESAIGPLGEGEMMGLPVDFFKY